MYNNASCSNLFAVRLTTSQAACPDTLLFLYYLEYSIHSLFHLPRYSFLILSSVILTFCLTVRCGKIITLKNHSYISVLCRRVSFIILSSAKCLHWVKSRHYLSNVFPQPEAQQCKNRFCSGGTDPVYGLITIFLQTSLHCTNAHLLFPDIYCSFRERAAANTILASYI